MLHTPIINPHVASTLRFEREQLKQIRIQIRQEAGLSSAKEIEEEEEDENIPSSKKWYQKIWNWLPKGFKSADIIIGSLQNSVPGLSFVGEFKQQLENLLPSGKR